MRKLVGIATAVAVCVCGTAAAARMAKQEYVAGKARIAAEYQEDRQKCGAHLGNPAEICVARARGTQRVALAELEAAYKPSPGTDRAAAIARARATYEIAKQECDDQKREARSGCLKDAKAARAKAEALAKAAGAPR